MTKLVLAMVVMLGMGTMLMADIPIGKFNYDLASTVKLNGKVDEFQEHQLKTMNKKIHSVIIAKDKSATLDDGDGAKEKFSYKKVSENKYVLPAGFGIEITSVSSKQVQLKFMSEKGSKRKSTLKYIYILTK